LNYLPRLSLVPFFFTFPVVAKPAKTMSRTPVIGRQRAFDKTVWVRSRPTERGGERHCGFWKVGIAGNPGAALERLGLEAGGFHITTDAVLAQSRCISS
jgi:hypothetical protein